jgi:small subunit ribosomal protein S18
MAKEPKRVKNKDNAKRAKKKVSLLNQERVEYVDYKDVNLLRRFMSDRAKIRARRVTGNDSQQQREVARAIKNAREMALLPYTTRVTTQRKVKSSDNADRAAEPAEIEVDVAVLDDVDAADGADGADLAEVDA